MEVLRMSKFRILFYVLFFSAAAGLRFFKTHMHKECVNSVRRREADNDGNFSEKDFIYDLAGKKIIMAKAP